MPGLLSLPPELLIEIIQACSPRERCHLRATCTILNEHADPIVFRHLRLYYKDKRISEHQIIALVTRSSKACEYTRDMEIPCMWNRFQASEQSSPHFGYCDDLRVHLPAAISTMRNLTCFRWLITNENPCWLIEFLLQAVARLPQLTELHVGTVIGCEASLPLGLFANLSTLAVQCDWDKHHSYFLSQMSTAIANSPRLKSLDMTYLGKSDVAPPLSEFFAKAKHPLCLEQLYTTDIDATVNQEMLPHLTQLTSFRFRVGIKNLSVARSVWTSFLVNNIKLTDVTMEGIIAEEMMLYLSSFSGLKSLVLWGVESPSGMTLEKLNNMFYEEVLPKHANSLRILRIDDARVGKWAFDHASSKSILKCLKLHDLYFYVVGNSMPPQLLLDTVARLPELRRLHVYRLGSPTGLADFKPKQGLRYVEEVMIGWKQYVLEKDGDRPVGYRGI